MHTKTYSVHLWFDNKILTLLIWFLADIIITVFAVYIGPGCNGHVIKEEARSLFHDGLENKLISFFQDLLSVTYPEQMVCSLFMLFPLILRDCIKCGTSPVVVILLPFSFMYLVSVL